MRAILALLLIAVIVTGCEERVRPAVAALPDATIATQESWKSTIRFTDSARVKAVLWAGHIAVFSAEGFTLLGDSIHIDFFNDRGEHTSTLTAKRGRVDDRTRDFAAHENVVVVSDSGTTLKTDSLFWRNADRKIHTAAFVDILSPTEHIMGQGLISDQALKNYRIFRVTGQAATRE